MCSGEMVLLLQPSSLVPWSRVLDLISCAAAVQFLGPLLAMVCSSLTIEYPTFYNNHQTTNNTLFSEHGAHITKHGDAVKDVAFSVEDCRGLYKRAIENGAVSVREPWTESDENGTITFATVRTVREIYPTFLSLPFLRREISSWIYPPTSPMTHKLWILNLPTKQNKAGFEPAFYFSTEIPPTHLLNGVHGMVPISCPGTRSSPPTIPSPNYCKLHELTSWTLPSSTHSSHAPWATEGPYSNFT